MAGGVQIVNITNPANSTLSSSIHNANITAAGTVDIATISNHTYAVLSTTEGIQLINITDPTAPAVTSIIHHANATAAPTVDIATVSNHTYAIISTAEGVQLVDITDPTAPTVTSTIYDADTMPVGGYAGVAIHTINGNTFVALTSEGGVWILAVALPDG